MSKAVDFNALLSEIQSLEDQHAPLRDESGDVCCEIEALQVRIADLTKKRARYERMRADLAAKIETKQMQATEMRWEVCRESLNAPFDQITQSYAKLKRTLVKEYGTPLDMHHQCAAILTAVKQFADVLSEHYNVQTGDAMELDADAHEEEMKVVSFASLSLEMRGAQA